MGKTKTAFVSEVKVEKSSADAYREKKEKQKAEEAKKTLEEKVQIHGLKGGKGVKVMSSEEPVVEASTPTEDAPKEEKKKTIEPKVRGKKYLGVKSKIELGKQYKTADAIGLVKDTSYSKFDGTVELHIVVKKVGTSAQITLPFSGGKAKRIEVADEATIKKLTTGKVDFDILLATPDMMPKLVAFARILGPKGLMPNPKNGTIIKNAKDSSKFSANTLNLKTEKDAPLIHTAVGKVSQKESELIDNIEAVLKALGGSKQIVRAFTKATMGPAVKLQVA
jgi:large subunit ribosomal protein L1